MTDTAPAEGYNNLEALNSTITFNLAITDDYEIAKSPI